MAAAPSDAFVFFGATGDLAFKQIFPSLQRLIKDEGLNVPIIGVSRTGSIEKLKERAKESLEQHGGLDQGAYQKLTELLRAVQGNYDDQETFQKLLIIEFPFTNRFSQLLLFCFIYCF